MLFIGVVVLICRSELEERRTLSIICSPNWVIFKIREKMKFKSKFIDDTQLDQATLFIYCPYGCFPYGPFISCLNPNDEVKSLLGHIIWPIWENMIKFFCQFDIQLAIKSYLGHLVEQKFIWMKKIRNRKLVPRKYASLTLYSAAFCQFFNNKTLNFDRTNDEI